MSWGEEQQKEIETIRERKITVKLSDADCDRLARKCGEHGLTIGELIENFVGDLVGGTYSNGSDERDYADQWFERCWFGMFPEPTLLNHLLNLGYEPEHYLDMLENVETIKSDIEITKQNIAEPSDEWKAIIAKDNQGKIIPEGDTDVTGLMCSAYQNTDGKEVFVMINYAAEDKEFTFYQRNGIIKNWKIYRTSDKDGENLLPVGSIKNHEKVVIPARSIITLVTQ